VATHAADDEHGDDHGANEYHEDGGRDD
jgi:hypothetical protein